MPTLRNAMETLQEKIRRYGENAHCTRIVVSEESRSAAIKNEADPSGKRKTIISFQTYSPECYSNWHETIGYLIERCSFNPILMCDLLLLLIQESRQHTEGEGVDGIDVALGALFKVGGDYEQKLRDAKSAYRARRKRC